MRKEKLSRSNQDRQARKIDTKLEASGTNAIIDSMAQLLVRKLPDQLVSRLKQVAAESGISSEEAHRQILHEALLSNESREKQFAPLKNILLTMPDVGADTDFERLTNLPEAPNLL